EGRFDVRPAWRVGDRRLARRALLTRLGAAEGAALDRVGGPRGERRAAVRTPVHSCRAYRRDARTTSQGEVTTACRAASSGKLDSMGTHLSRDFGGVRVDTSDWPIIVMEFPEHRFPDADFEAALGQIEQIMQECRSSGHKCAQITDLTRMQQIAPASQR